MKIHEALVAVKEEVGAVDKGGFNAGQKFKFRGVDQVVNAVAGALARNGVIVFPVDVHTDYTERTNAKGGAVVDARVRATYRWVGPEGDFVDAMVVAEGRDMADKATAKAMSVAYRICILQTLSLPTDDPDPDSEYPEVPGKAQGGDEGALVVSRRMIQQSAQSKGLDESTLKGLMDRAGVEGRISQCGDLAALNRLADLIRNAA